MNNVDMFLFGVITREAFVANFANEDLLWFLRLQLDVLAMFLLHAVYSQDMEDYDIL